MKQRDLGTNAGWDAHHSKKKSMARKLSYRGKKGKGSLNPPFRSKENNSIMEGGSEEENA